MALDVLITGAGPVGLAMAIELSRFGLLVRLVDKAAARTDKSKALVIWSRTLELLDRSGVGAKLLAAGQPTSAANLMSGAKRLARITFEGVETPHPYALMIPQSETERVLEEHLAGLGVAVERSTELLSFIDNGSAVSCVLRGADGAQETVESAWLIGCDGAHSTVRHQLELSFEGDTLPTDWMLADVILEGMPEPNEMHISLHHDGALAIFPIGPAVGDRGRARVIANVGAAKEGVIRPDPTLADTQAVLDARGPGNVTASDPVWLANFRINERKVREYRQGRVFVAGDAAHIHSPAGGQGMNTGIQDACNLAWKLALVQLNLLRPEILESYTAERSPVAEQVLKSTGLLTRAGTLEGAGLQAVRNAAISLALGLSPARRAVAKELMELSVGYPRSPLNFEKSPVQGPRPGERAPLRAEEALAGSSAPPKFVLFAERSADAEQFIACFPGLIESEPRSPFGEGGLWLVRPDGYVAYSAAEGEWAAMDSAFTQLVVWRTEA